MDLGAGRALTTEVAAISVPRRSRSRGRIVGVLVPILTFAVLIFLWWSLVALFTIPEYLVPAPQAVIPSLIANWPDLWTNSTTTLTEIVLGFLITVLFGIPMGLVIALSLT